jgi:hypothetical protein
MLLLRQKQATSQPKREEFLDLLEWTWRYRSVLAPEVYFDIDNHKYIKALFTSTARRMVVRKASQVGASEWAVSKAFYSCDQRKMNVFYVMPSERDTFDFSQMRVGPAIESSPYLQSLVVGAFTGNTKRGADRATMKRIGERFLTFRGAAVTPDGRARALKSVPADLAIRDEVDEMDHRVAEIVRKRLAHSPHREELAMSTPTYPGIGIDAEWAISDQRHWYIPCPRCGHQQAPTLEHLILEEDELGQPSDWHGKKEGRAWLACSKCGEELDRSVDGEWVAKYPERRVEGYHLSRLITVQADLLELVLSLQTTNESKLKEIYNQDLAEPYQVQGGQITDEEIDACRRDYPLGEKRAPISFAGVDVGRVLHVVIRARADAAGDRHLLWAGEVAGFGDLPALFARYNVKQCVIDAMPETRKAREFQALLPKESVWLCYYTGTVEKKSEEAVWNKAEGVVSADRTRVLDAMYSQFYGEVNTLPANIRELRDYYEHLKASIRITKETNVGPATLYINSKPDHYAHSEVYAYIASLRPLSSATTSAPSQVTDATDFFE